MPDFRGRLERALEILAAAPPDVMNHNLETVPRLYQQARPGRRLRAFAARSCRQFKRVHPAVPTKSGLMVGLGETDDEILAVMRDLRAHDVDMLTIGQYLQPSPHHLPVERYVEPGGVREVRERGGGDGLPARRDRAAGALLLPRRPAGARSRRRSSAGSDAARRRRLPGETAPGRGYAETAGASNLFLSELWRGSTVHPTWR